MYLFETWSIAVAELFMCPFGGLLMTFNLVLLAFSLCISAKQLLYCVKIFCHFVTDQIMYNLTFFAKAGYLALNIVIWQSEYCVFEGAYARLLIFCKTCDAKFLIQRDNKGSQDALQKGHP